VHSTEFYRFSGTAVWSGVHVKPAMLGKLALELPTCHSNKIVQWNYFITLPSENVTFTSQKNNNSQSSFDKQRK